jgi:FKBP-type peptidyl-prolyl cis-trans isomerase
MWNSKGLLIGVLALAGQTAWAAEPAVLNTPQDRISYSIGASIGKNLRSDMPQVDLKLLFEALRASLAGDKLLLQDKEIQQVMSEYQTQLRQQAAARRQTALSDNQKIGDAYLSEYKAQKGVQMSPGGVLYKVLKEGSGPKPLESDLVLVNYRGTLVNGKQFDATAPGQPASLKVSALIPGWKQALSMMSVGSKWQIVVPSSLAYGERGAGNDIGPNEVLLFDLELVGIR